MITNQSFLRVAQEIASNSKAVRLKVGSVLVNLDNHIIGTGYNGTPSGSNYDIEKLENVVVKRRYYLKLFFEKKTLIHTNPWVIHSELNCILNATTNNLTGCKIYCTHSPCVHCAAIIVQKGISHVYYLDEYRNTKGLDFLKAHNVYVEKIEL